MGSEFNLPLNDYGIEQTIGNAGDCFRILDMGCGKAEYHQKLKEEVLGPRLPDSKVEIYGIDSDEEAVEIAKSSYDQLEGYNYSVEDATDTDFREDYFDIVLSQHLACRIEQDDELSIEQDLIPESERLVSEDNLIIHECP